MAYQTETPPSADFTGEYVALRSDKGNMLVRRWIGCWIDFIVLAIVSLGPFFATGNLNVVVQRAALLIGLVCFLGYFPLTEGIWGRSVGKFITGTIVVKRDGSRASFGQAVGRTLMRLVEVNPFLMGGVPAGISLLATKGKQRLGDLAAGTYVVPVKALQTAMAARSFEVF